MGGIANSIYIVTGAAGNIGREVAATLSHLGAGIVGLDMHCLENSMPLKAPQSGQIINFKLDLTDEKAVKHFFVEVAKWPHKINGLINCSGMVFFKPLLETSIADFRSVLEANLISAFIVTQQAIKLMRLDGGRIIHLGSISGSQSIENNVGYGTAKAGLAHFSRIVNTEFNKYNIQSTVLVLGAVQSTIWDNYPEFALSKMLTLQEVAEKIIFILNQPVSLTIEEISLVSSYGVLNV
jgi:NAD(P)-dependent dehydrogenase (short-subunit alcohol dehydrogenase family)